MWKPRLHFITIHYTYIIALTVLGWIVMAAYGNLSVIDAFFLGTSAATVTGLTTVNVNDMKLYQQLAIYFIPIIGNMVFINMTVVVVRLGLFERRIKQLAPGLLHQTRSLTRTPSEEDNLEHTAGEHPDDTNSAVGPEMLQEEKSARAGNKRLSEEPETKLGDSHANEITREISPKEKPGLNRATSNDGTIRVAFTDEVKPPPSKPRALYVPPPFERDRGHPLVEVEEGSDDESVRNVARTTDADYPTPGLIRQRTIGTTRTLERVASSLFVVGKPPSQTRKQKQQPAVTLSKDLNLPYLSSQATVGRNSRFHNLTAKDRERIGGIEYRSLKLLIKVLVTYFFGLHAFGAICLVAWILHADPKYHKVLSETGTNKVWWGFYSAQTMTNNLGFTLTPTSMIPFQDAVFPLIIMTFLGYVGNTFYPCMLRLIIWAMFNTVPKRSSLREPLNYLLRHPRRCYTLLFPRGQTWALFGILLVLNGIDVILFIALDLHIKAVNNLPAGVRFLAALFQVTSSRHTGTSTFSLTDIHPAVQFSLLVMMYISVFPIALSVRSSNTYEEKALGVFPREAETDNKTGRSYLAAHIKNQLVFDIWYIFLGVFCICISEADRIMNPAQPEISIFAIFFEAVSAYGNVGLSLGYPTADTPLCGQFTTFGKVIICLLMIRGRHRGMPSQIDRAVMLPSDLLAHDVRARPGDTQQRSTPAERLKGMKRFNTN